MEKAQIEALQTKYRRAKPSFLGRGIDKLTHPVGETVAKILPRAVIAQVVKGLDRTVGTPELMPLTHDTADMRACQEAAEEVARTARNLNASSGAAAGLAGALTASADIPATIAIALRNIRDTGRAFGFDGEGKRERLFRLQILEIAALDDVQEKVKRLDALEADIYATGELAPVGKQGVEPLIDQIVERISRAIAFATVRGRLGMLVPIAGSVVGGIVNAQFQRDVGRAAQYAYRARRLRTID